MPVRWSSSEDMVRYCILPGTTCDFSLTIFAGAIFCIFLRVASMSKFENGRQTRSFADSRFVTVFVAAENQNINSQPFRTLRNITTLYIRSTFVLKL
jgi:hypothetical protein